MKLYLASFLEPENFGPGRLIGIANGNKPRDIKVDVTFPHLIPPVSLMERYRKLGLQNKSEASKMFVEEFTKQLDNFSISVIKQAEEKGKKPIDILPFKEGDTLASWERVKFSNYRSLVATALEKLGFEVVLK